MLTNSGISQADPDSTGTGEGQLFSLKFIKSDAKSMETFNTEGIPGQKNIETTRP
jgi:hypothetical protein